MAYDKTSSVYAGKNIQELRNRQGLTRGDLIAKVNIEGFTARILGRVEQGTRLIKEDELDQVCRVLLGSTDYTLAIRSGIMDFDALDEVSRPLEPSEDDLMRLANSPRAGCTRCNYDHAVKPYRLCPSCSNTLDQAYRDAWLAASTPAR